MQDCIEKLDNCLGKFIPTRRDQPKICIKCLYTLGINEAFPLIKIKDKLKV